MSPVDTNGQNGPTPDEDFDAISQSIDMNQDFQPATQPVAPRQVNDVVAPAAPAPQTGFVQPPVAQPIQVIEPAAPEEHVAPEAPSFSYPTQQAAPVAEDQHPEDAALEQPVAAQSPSTKKFAARLAVEAVLVAALLGVASYAFTLRSSNAELKSQITTVSQNPQLAVERQTKTQIAKVGQLMQLPQDEQPTVASVSDAAKAKAQSAFFANAQDGDTVLMYVKSGQAILYRPTTNRIVLVAPLTFDNKAATTTPAAATTPTTKR